MVLDLQINNCQDISAAEENTKRMVNELFSFLCSKLPVRKKRAGDFFLQIPYEFFRPMRRIMSKS